MGHVKPYSIERDRLKKRVGIPVRAEVDFQIQSLAVNNGKPASQVAAYIVYRGLEEVRQRPPDTPRRWPALPPNAELLRIQAAMSPETFLDLYQLARDEFETLKTTAAAMLEIGLAEYLKCNKHSAK